MKFKRFILNTSGNVSVLLALAGVPMMIAVGAGVDMVLTNQANTVLQGAADAAALAGASAGELSQAEIDDLAEKYLMTNNSGLALDDIDKIETHLDKDKRTFSVRIEGTRKTSLMYLAGIENVGLSAYSEVQLPGSGLEVALVLDNTASMLASGRLPALKSAAKALVEDLFAGKGEDAYLRVGIVPFSDYVNVGLSRRNESWLDVEDDKSETKNRCWNTYPNATSSNCRNVPYIVDGIDQGTTTQQCDWNYGAPVEECAVSTWTYTWNGCVGSRPDPIDETIGSVSTRYKGLVNQSCTTEIVTLTDDKQKLLTTIDSFVATGETYAPAGLLWGWNMLDSQKPLTEAKPTNVMMNKGGTKAIVLMTDGQNTLAPYDVNHYGWNGAADWARGDAKTQALCNNIKADGIAVYTVSFMVTDPGAQALMANCATDSAKAFSADDAAQLSMAFEEIGQSLMAVHISK